MECKTNSDFYFGLIPIYNEANELLDFLLVEMSENFYQIFKIGEFDLIGRRVSDIIFHLNEFFPSFKDVYYKLTPDNSKKYKEYISELGNFYLINIFTSFDLKTYIYFLDLSWIKSNENLAIW